ncbi:cysteine protease ATG4D [Bradysia coprophila]|uniref:cysteine protease ATG4D n=1 Tax=Bradysia coprophila TaxID=38358 RepID=UPI00187D7E64|nr:cysteine protease ATG4D [Bradysia coprophila]
MSYDVLLTRPGPGRFTFNPNASSVQKDSSQAQHQQQPKDGQPNTNISPKRESGTPARKISSSRFMAAFSQFYGNEDVEDVDSPGNTRAQQVQKTGDESFPEIKGRVESKLMSMWHNVKYGWGGKMRQNFSKEQPVWLLGRCYHRKFSPVSSMENSVELTNSADNKSTDQHHNQIHQHYDVQELYDVQEYGTDAIEGEIAECQWEEGIEGFKRDFCSRLWMTYRREFPILNGSNYTSDCGWGCMIRSGQMMLAEALIRHFLSRSWRWDAESQIHITHDDNMHRKIIRWFGDSSSKNSPFSIHTLVNLGEESGKRAGDWYGPSSVSHLLRQAVKLASQENADFDDVNVYVAQDCTVYIQDILDECLVPEPPTGPVTPWRKKSVETFKHGTSNMHWKSVILLVPLRLGAEKLNPIYGNSLKTLLSTEYCIGIIGGRPKHSLYFVGFQEDKLIHLDPHYCQEMVDVNQDNFSVHSFHCKSPRKLKLSKLDPSCCIGFYCQTKNDFDNFVASVQPYLLPIRQSPQPGGSNSSPEPNYPLFVFSRSRSSEYHVDEVAESIYKPMQQQLRNMMNQNDATETWSDDDDETDEFVII